MPETLHYGFGHGCDQCKLALILHKGCPQVASNNVEKVTPTVTEATESVAKETVFINQS